MALAVNSRFAVLSIDDDEDVKRSSKKKSISNNLSSQKNDSKKKDGKKPNNTKSQPSLANQSTNSKNKTSKANKKKANADEKQWEQWKRKDEEMVNGNYENELHEAMLLSQLDFEKKKEIYAAAAAQAKEQEANTNKKEKEKKQKKNKPITMSLSEFNSRMEPPQTQESGGKGDGPGANAVEEADPEFFDRVKEDTKKVLHQEKQVEKRKAREPFVNQEIALARLEEKLERKEKEVVQLSEEVTRLKEELKTVRARNRDLCLIMSQGEMKDKAEVLVAMEKTTMVKDELSGEVERLHALLEQERSKVRALTQNSDKNKKGKKRTASENN